MALTTQAYGLVKNTLYFCTGSTGSATGLFFSFKLPLSEFIWVKEEGGLIYLTIKVE